LIIPLVSAVRKQERFTDLKSKKMYVTSYIILISNFRHVLNVVCFLLGESPASEVTLSLHL